jgi:hypothetical protein
MGANPVFYIANNSLVDISHSPVFRNLDVRPGCGLGRPGHLATREEVFDKLMSANAATDRKLYSVLNQCDVTEERSAHIPEGLPDLIFDSRDIQRELSKLVFSFCVPFDDAQEEEGEKNYYMEREWRTLGNVQFQLTDVHRIILPETYAVQLRADVPDYCGQVTFAD